MPINTILVGIVSNGLACLILVHYGFQGAWREWGEVAWYCMWCSAALTGLITVLLGISILTVGRVGKARG